MTAPGAAGRQEEVPLLGGQVGGAVRVGDTVRRPSGPWTPAVHVLLTHLAARGLDGIPAVVGTDEQGREVLGYVPGRPIPLDAVTEPLLASGAAWLRRFHAAVADFRPGPRRWRFVERDLAPGEIVCHHDAAMYNMLAGTGLRADEVVGVVDWDVAGPGTPLDDLAHLAWSGVPLYEEPDIAAAAHRLRVLAAAYRDAAGRDDQGAVSGGAVSGGAGTAVTTGAAPAVTSGTAPAVTTGTAPAVTSGRAPAVTSGTAAAVTTGTVPAVTSGTAAAVTTAAAPVATAARARGVTARTVPGGEAGTPPVGRAGTTPTALQIAEHVPVRVAAGCERIAAGQRAGDPGMLNLDRVGEPSRTLAQRQRYVDRTLPALRAALAAPSDRI